MRGNASVRAPVGNIERGMVFKLDHWPDRLVGTLTGSAFDGTKLPTMRLLGRVGANFLLAEDLPNDLRDTQSVNAYRITTNPQLCCPLRSCRMATLVTRKAASRGGQS